MKSLVDETERFWQKVQKTDTCWLWTGHIGNKGYGYYAVSLGGGKYKHHLTHRYSYILANGSIPNKLFVLHTCDTRACVRPDHLFLGTHQDNMDDMKQKMRQAHGPNTRTAVLTETQAIAMLHEYADGEHNQRLLADKYGVNFRTVWNLLHGWTWKHLDRTGIDIEENFRKRAPKGQKKPRPSRAKVKAAKEERVA